MVDPEVMKGPHTFGETTKRNPLERESKLARVKRMLTCQQRAPTTFDEAKASAKARKRKERQESINSLSQERKVIRSNSEERPNDKSEVTENGKDIRRVSSNEDFQLNNQHVVASDCVATLAILDGPVRIIPHREVFIDDCEYERRRSHERFSRPPLVQRGRHGKKPKGKQFPKTPTKENQHVKIQATKKIEEDTKSSDTENEEICILLKANVKHERSPSPANTPVSPAIDLTTLHQQIDCSDPIPSNTNRDIDETTETLPSLSVASTRLLSSPRNSVITTERIYLNPDVQQHSSLKDTKNPVEQRLKQLAKQINSVKKKIKKYDEEFEMRHGYKASHADKLNDKAIKKLCVELSKLKRDQKQLQEDSSSVMGRADANKKPAMQLKDTVLEIGKRLDQKRASGERSEVIEELSNEQLIEEKIAVQKALLYLESVHGRPCNKDDKDIARPLYDRYRTLKRNVARLTVANSGNELATIHEHETMDFVSLPSQPLETESEKVTLTGSTDSDTDTSIGENLHALTLDELLEQQKVTGEEKKQLRRSLKEFEAKFESQTGRKLQKEDKLPMETTYTSYKKAKAKLRLLDALVGKQT